MKDIKLLDCTLRDGGYINDWEFGASTITCVFERLVRAGIDIIEVGFLDDRRKFDPNRTIQPTTACYDKLFAGCDKKGAMVVAMIDYGTCDINNIGPCEESFIDGIRVIFKKPKMRQAVDYARQLMEKGYKVSLQLVSITSYEDRDILDLVDLINDIEPYAVSMVDTYGLMHKEQMSHYFHLLNHNLKPSIIIGYHSHNNFQLGYSNEVEMLKRATARTLLVDGTVYGMGKSAGNAPLELLAMYLNENYGKHYELDQILEIIDVNIMKIYQQHYWGYSLLFFLAASNNCHPNYIDYLLNKHTLSVKSINDIVKKLEGDRKLNYSKDVIEELYRQYQERTVSETETISSLSEELSSREILLLGPGKSLADEEAKIRGFIREKNPLVISVNCLPDNYPIHYAFFGNSKRYSSLFHYLRKMEHKCKTIATSNISAVGDPFDFVFRYDSLRDDEPVLADNAFVMILRALSMVNVPSVTLAGFDGFSESTEENYYDKYLDYVADYAHLSAVNKAIACSIAQFREKMTITFLTKTRYEV